MPFFGNERNGWKLIQEAKQVYKNKLIAKGVIDGTSKMNKLMWKKFI